MSGTFGRNVAVLTILILAPGSTAFAQVTAGEASMNLAGSVSGGYSGSYGNTGPSSHGFGFGGNGDLSGFYHSSQFLSFDVAPFYDQSRDNSNYQSITDSSGVTASTSIFGGSKYPGYLNYSDVYNSEGNYFLPGITNYKSNGNTQTFGVGWTANPTEALSFSAGYQSGSNQSSIYGTNNEFQSDFNSLFATTRYNVAGFRLSGGIRHSDGTYTFPQILAGETSQGSHVDTTTYNFGLSRGVGWNGSTWMNFSRNTTTYNTLGSRDSQTDDVVSGGVALKPTKKLNTSFGADYDDNLAAAVYQAENSAGAILPLALPQEKSHSWGTYGEAQYSLGDQFYLTGDIMHRQQLFLGTAVSSTAYSGGVNYGHELYGGHFTGGMVVSRSGLGTGGGSLVGLLGNAIYTRRVGAWNMNGSFSYSRSVQSLLIAYTSTGYSYSTSAGRRLGRLFWNGSASGSKSVFSEKNAPTSFTQSYATGLSSRWLGVSAGYSRSSGLGLYTAQGIATSPSGLPPVLIPSPVHYGGTTYSVGLGGTPVRGLTFSGSFDSTRSSTVNELLASNNHTEEGNAYLQYRFRKVFFTAGYSRLIQGFSASTLAPAMVSTYYVGLSRWFNFF